MAGGHLQTGMVAKKSITGSNSSNMSEKNTSAGSASYYTTPLGSFEKNRPSSCQSDNNNIQNKPHRKADQVPAAQLEKFTTGRSEQ